MYYPQKRTAMPEMDVRERESNWVFSLRSMRDRSVDFCARRNRRNGSFLVLFHLCIYYLFLYFTLSGNFDGWVMIDGFVS